MRAYPRSKNARDVSYWPPSYIARRLPLVATCDALYAARLGPNSGLCGFRVTSASLRWLAISARPLLGGLPTVDCAVDISYAAKGGLNS